MPYINIRTTPAFECKEKTSAAKQITENLASILNKPVRYHNG